MLKVENIQRLDLGVQGENRSRAIEIDCGLWKELYPNCNISIYHQRPGDTSPDVTGSEYDVGTGILRWEPTASDTNYNGEGWAEIRATMPGTTIADGGGSAETMYIIRKSMKVRTIVHPSVTDDISGTIESTQQAYINAVDQIRSHAAASENSAENYSQEAEAWAVGQRDGVDVDPTDPTYHNNAKHYKDLAEQDMTGRGFFDVYLDEHGHLIFLRVDVLENVDFTLEEGRLTIWLS